MLATKTHINNEFIDDIKLLRSVDERVTCEAKNVCVCDKADMNLGKGNIAMWYHYVVCGRERAVVSIGFTWNRYGWVPAATQLAVTLAPVTLHGEVSPWDIYDLIAMDSVEKYTCLEMEVMSYEGELVLWRETELSGVF